MYSPRLGLPPLFSFFFFNDTATTEIYTLSLHDALPICRDRDRSRGRVLLAGGREGDERAERRSEEHTSELQSRSDLVCRLLLEKKKKSTSFRCTPTRDATASTASLRCSCLRDT